jgi:hypothetical protein
MYIDDWAWDDANLDELAQHGLTRRTVEQVSEERPHFRRNKGGRAATHQMIGPDKGGKLWIVCIAQIPGVPGRWRAITGWPAEPEDIRRYERRP